MPARIRQALEPRGDRLLGQRRGVRHAVSFPVPRLRHSTTTAVLTAASIYPLPPRAKQVAGEGALSSFIPLTLSPPFSARRAVAGLPQYFPLAKHSLPEILVREAPACE